MKQRRREDRKVARSMRAQRERRRASVEASSGEQLDLLAAMWRQMREDRALPTQASHVALEVSAALGAPEGER